MSNRVGVIASLRSEGGSLKYVADFGLKVCQLVCWNPDLYTAERAELIRRESEETGIQITSLWGGWPGPAAWNFIDGPSTLGIVPREYREVRVAALKSAGEFAHQILISHHLVFGKKPCIEFFFELVNVFNIAKFQIIGNVF